MSKKISLFSLVLLIVAAIDSIRNLPATAIFGSASIFFFLMSALIFLIPIALIAAEFSSRFTEGGIFHWVRQGCGEKMATLAIWLQWINTMIWYPTILCFIAGTAAYLIDPALAQNKPFLVIVTLTIFWSLTLLNLRGIHISAKINSFCGIVGLFIPMLFLAALGLAWLLLGNPSQITFSSEAMLPSLSGSQHWVSLIAIMASFLGMELAGVHVSDIKDPAKNFPRALAWSVLLLLATMISGALSIAIVVPAEKIRLVDGIMQSFTLFFRAFHLEWAAPLLALLIIIGSTGGMINWLLSPAKGLLQAASRGFLPAFLAKENSNGVPARLLIGQAVLVSCFCLAVIMSPSVNAFYWFLTNLSTELYMLMYVLLFISALKLGRPKEKNAYQIPMGLRRTMCFSGLSGCALTVWVGYFAPDGIDVGTSYPWAVAISMLLAILPVGLLWAYQTKSKGTSSKEILTGN